MTHFEQWKDSKLVIKLENKERLNELNPASTLKKIGFKDGDTFCDIGAGTGIFAFEAAKLTNEKVYAVDISEVMLQILENKNKEYKTENITILNDIKNIPAAACNTMLLCTVLHEINDATYLFNEIKRISKPKGKLAIIEFHKKETPFGPPVGHRLSQDDTEKMLISSGLTIINSLKLGENFYMVIAEV